MAKKHDTRTANERLRKRYKDLEIPERLLQFVIEELERGIWDGNFEALFALLSYGPLKCPVPVHDLLTDKVADEELAAPGGEMLAYLRSLVRGNAGTLNLKGAVAFMAHVDEGRVRCYAQGTLADLAALQLVILTHKVGLPNIRLCAATDCPGPHLFVKTYRREFCSVRCQKRTNARNLRRPEIEHRRKERERQGVRKSRQQQRKEQQRNG